MAKSPYDYEPVDHRDKNLDEDAKGEVRLGMTDGSEDPINTRTEEEIRNSRMGS
jgi:hypothetical protein